VIRERILPLARDVGVVVAIEKIWDGFVFGPSEVARYVDAFDSPWVKAGFDTATSVFYTDHQDWIRILGGRLAKVRIGGGRDELAEVRRALEKIEYDGWVTATVS
jgi:hexulose-6-phosphate isomerase